MEEMDRWTEKHSWATSGWVPADRITPNLADQFPSEVVTRLSSPHAIQQVRTEIHALVEEIYSLALQSGTILEIGLGHAGGTHMLWSKIFSKIITIEIDRAKVFRFYQDISIGMDSHLIVGNSQDVLIRRMVHQISQTNVNVLFIDGDHSYEGVKADWILYRGLVRKGGLICFHDTQMNGDKDLQVRRFVEELESGEYGSAPREMRHIRHSKCIGISYYQVN